jgi:hypothetical protein
MRGLPYLCGVCPYNVPFINERGVAQIDVALCQGAVLRRRMPGLSHRAATF